MMESEILETIVSHRAELQELEMALSEVKTRLAGIISRRLPSVVSQSLLPVSGKLNRARLVLAFAGLGGGIRAESLEVATAVELIHWASLLHDDIVDEADWRRNRPSLHRERGTKVALLLGDWFFSEAYHCLDGKRNYYTQALNRAINLMAAGELEFEVRQGCQESDSLYRYFRYIYRKTAIFFQVCAGMGVYSVDPRFSPRLDAAVKAGQWWGMAYQIRDDLADVMMEPKELGKPGLQGCGIISASLPLLLLVKKDSSFREKIPCLSQAEICVLLEKTGVMRECLEIRDRLIRKAEGALTFFEGQRWWGLVYSWFVTK